MSRSRRNVRAFAAIFLPMWSVLFLSAAQSATCPNLAGLWTVDEDVTLTVTQNGESQTIEQSGTAQINLIQNGCTVTYYEDIPNPYTGGTYRAKRVGTIKGDTVTFTGVAIVPIPGATITKNSLVAVGKIQGNVINAISTVDVIVNSGSMTATVKGGGTAIFSADFYRSFALSGSVKQGTTSGPPAPGVEVQLVNSDFSTWTTVTDDQGNFSFNNLPIDTYTLTPIDAGFNFQPPQQTAFVYQDTTLPPFVILKPALSLHRVTAATIDAAPSDDIDAPLGVKADPKALADLPLLGNGVVADGVTPVLLQLDAHPSTATSYTIELTVNGGSVDLSGKLRVLSNGAFIPGSTISIAPPDTQGFAYLEGLELQDSDFSGPLHELQVDVKISSGGVLQANSSFKIRPPPIALVHGIADSGETWSPQFTQELDKWCPDDFIFPISYGVGTGSDTTWPNTTDTLTDLALLLDDVLKRKVENSLILTGWAFTRYDVVGHSQGGVLLRMLCQTDINGGAAFVRNPVVSKDNYYRGRFRRVITIGSPHNGSLLARYIWRLALSPWFRDQLVFEALADHTPLKFDPFGWQIQDINDPDLRVDSRMKFNCIRTTIFAGRAPGPGHDPLCYTGLGLTNPYVSGDPDVHTRGDVLLPHGSDGVVDFQSQGGGNGTMETTITGTDIAHMEFRLWGIFVPLFGVPAGLTETEYSSVAEKVKDLLSGPANKFGPFFLPDLLTDASKYDALVPTDITPRDMIFPIILAQRSLEFQYSLQVPPDLPQGGDVTWYAQVFGSNGLSMAGASLVVDTNNPMHVTVSADDTLAGTLVLYADYTTTNGDFVPATPVVVISRPLGTDLSSVELEPASVELSVGDSVLLHIWGNYTNGTRSLLYIPSGQASYVSSNPDVATVNSAGAVTMNSNGTATIIATYDGSSAAAIISSAGQGNKPDTGKPTVKITNPRPHSRLTNALITVSGQAADKVAVGFVMCQINGGDWRIATSSDGWTNWTISADLNPGANIVRAFAIDTSGNPSPTNTTSFYYVLTAPVTVQTDGVGTVTPNLNGGLLEIGKTYSVTAHPGKGFAFQNWTGSAASASARLSFVMQSNLNFTAHFVDAARPVNIVTFPAVGKTVTNTPFVAMGKAADNVGVASVWYQIDGAGWNPATTVNAFTNWTTAALPITAGPRIVQVFAIDAAGNYSRTNTVSFSYMPP
jgi:pimeloyl-ACP methyl ester carboxylesterase